MPKIITNTSLLFHHAQFPSVTVFAGKKAEVPAWVLRTTTFGSHSQAGNIAVDQDPAKEAPPVQPRATKPGPRLKPAPLPQSEPQASKQAPPPEE